MQLAFQYPRIYSLSTIGIIYHGDCDYVLHPHCTSFAGDSGVGKSIVADLLQLIFTGPGVYESATRSQQPRRLSGLVAQGLAYAYINVETSHGQYVGLGCYLEASGAAYPFIVHAGYHEDQLIRFKQPLGFRDFLLDGQIKPIKTWLERLRRHPQGVHAQLFSNNYRRYHQLLYQQHILPLDVGSSEELLKNYAKIIRSFARSGELEKGSIDYLDFLFGKEAQEAIWTDYQKLVDEFERDEREQHEQHSLIKETKDKVAAFRELLDLREQAQLERLDYAKAQVRHYRYQLQQKQQELSTLRFYNQQHNLSYFQLEAELLRRKADAAHREQEAYLQATRSKPELTKRLPQLDNAAEQARLAEQAQQQRVQELAKSCADADCVEQWLAGPFGHSPNELVLAQRQQEKQRVQKRQLDEFIAYLNQHCLAHTVATSAWATQSPTGDQRAYLHGLQARLSAAEQLQQFNDLRDAESLALWALKHGKALSREQESILAHFSSLPKLQTRLAAKNQRYLADPATLLALPIPELPGSDENGFWLNLRGVGEWIARLQPQHCVFFDNDVSRIKALLTQRATAAEQTVGELRQAVQAEQRFQEQLQAYGDWQTGLQLYNQREQLTAAAVADILPEETRLHEMLQHYTNRSQLEHELAEARLGHSTTLAHFERTKQAAQATRNDLTQIEQLLLATTQKKLDGRAAEIAEQQQALYAQLTKWLNENQLNSTVYQDHIVEEIQDSLLTAEQDQLVAACATHKEKSSAGLVNTRRAAEAFEKCRQQTDAAQQSLQKLTEQPFAIDDDPVPPSEPDETCARKAETQYEAQFRALAIPLGSEGTRLAPHEVATLIQRAVPAAVKHFLDQPEEAFSELLVYLEEISAQSNQLTEHKLNRLGEVLNRVRTTVNAYRNEIEQLESYFRRGEAGIAGGFSAKLSASLAPEYPLEWLHHFQDVLYAKARGEVGALNGLRQAETLLKLMRAAYIEKGGKHQQVKAEELLDPKSYLRLTYRMEAEGQVNHGSTGQTFMAAALLNIARLSLIGRDGRQHKRRPGVRFMPIDEAAGLGSNYTNLLKLAAQQGYQVVSLAIEPVLDADPAAATAHRIYVLGAGPPKAKLNLTPMMLRGSKAETIDEDEFYNRPTALDLFNDVRNAN